MGNCHLKQEFDAENITGKFDQRLCTSRQSVFISFPLIALSKSAFNYQYCIGKGGFGKVWKVERKKTKQQYAMKEMSKARILSKRSLKSVMNER